MGERVLSVIAEFPPQDNRVWHVQCARCGSSVGYDEVSTIDLGDIRWRFCLSGAEWCEANPLEGRESVRRGEFEWYATPRGDRE